jgi:hypothetical protein
MTDMAPTEADRAAIAADLARLHEKHSDDADFVPVKSVESMLIAGYVVLPHVQRFADDVRKSTKVKTIGTYPGHSPSLDRALDLFHAIGDTALATAIAQFAIANQARYGVRYVIDRQRIWHRLDPVWRWMEDRGDNTQNHMDHDHVSFELVAAEVEPEPIPEPEPVPEPEEAEGMKLIAVTEDRGIFLAGENVGDDGKIPARHVGAPEEVVALVESGAVAGYDKRPALPAPVFDTYYRVVG